MPEPVEPQSYRASNGIWLSSKLLFEIMNLARMVSSECSSAIGGLTQAMDGKIYIGANDRDDLPQSAIVHIGNCEISMQLNDDFVSLAQNRELTIKNGQVTLIDRE